MGVSSFIFQPLLPLPFIIAGGAAALVLLILTAARGGKGVTLRGLAFLILILTLLNPQKTHETLEAQPDVAVVVVDQSASQNIGNRAKQTEEALIAVKSALSQFNNLEIKIEYSEKRGATNLFQSLTKAAAHIPPERFAGAVLITDGQIHDAPTLPLTPVHVLLSGNREENDRRIIIEKAPGYGIIGKSATLAYRIEDRLKGLKHKTAQVHISVDGVKTKTVEVPIGETQRFTFTLNHAGKSVVELSADPLEGELSTLNNRAAVSINGVRDKLKVLLVSGQPHMGGRAWRNLLKSDPAVDLIHFTILRTVEKDNFTPLRELSLIVFPIMELFDVKLHEFDLIVFDRYVLRDVLPVKYLNNIKSFLLGGGAILLASGPEFAGRQSLFKTVLGDIMPAKPTGRVMEKIFMPELTDIGRRHPVTANLSPPWGRWFRQTQVSAITGDTLLTGPDGNPLLVLQRVGKGRIAQLMSDYTWLWARGFEGGGPHGELMRRIAHWLMKEPDLEEENLKARIKDGQLTIQRQSLSGVTPIITLTAPSGETRELTLKASKHGMATVQTPASELGLYRVSDGTKTALAAAGALNPKEFSDLRSTEEILLPIVKSGGGGISWIKEGLPDFRRVRQGRRTAGRGWIGFKENKFSVVTGTTQAPLLQSPWILLLLLASLALAWRREGK